MLLFTYSIVPQHFCLTRALFVSLPPFVCSESIMCGVWCVHVYVIVCPLVELNRTIHPHMIRWVRNFDFYCWISPVISSLFLSLWHNGRATGHMANFCRIHSFSCTTTIVRPSCYTWCATRSTCTISMTISGVLSLLWWPNILFSCSGIQLFGIHSLICSHLTSMVFFSRNMYSYSPAMRLIDHWPRTNRAIRQRQSALYLNHLCVHLIYIFLHNRRISLFCCSIEAR